MSLAIKFCKISNNIRFHYEKELKMSTRMCNPTIKLQIYYNCRMSDIESNKVVGKGNIMSKEIEID